MNVTELHRDERKRLYRRWAGMHERCTDPKHKSFNRYGARGITVDPAWNDFGSFLEWALANGYSPELKIDRKENDKGYSPDNCRFVPHVVNCNNQERSESIEALGEKKTRSMWTRDSRVSVSTNTIHRRIKKGIDPDIAVTAASGALDARFVTAFGETKSIALWTRDSRCSVPYSALFFRLDHGWPTEEAIITPSGALRGRQRKAKKIVAFGEAKTLVEWAADPRCNVRSNTIELRIVKYGWDAEKAITKPSQKKGKLK